MEDAQGLCDRVGILNEGVLIAEGSLEELRELAQSGTNNLEEIFLELTEQTESVAQATARLQGDYQRDV
jgi:ABC-2 type transport system ATP-binding protein